MKDVQFFYDPISPYAHLAFAALPQALMGHSVMVRYRPVLFAALLKANGQLGPAEIAAKRTIVTHMSAELLGRQNEIALEAAHDGLVVEF